MEEEQHWNTPLRLKNINLSNYHKNMFDKKVREI